MTAEYICVSQCTCMLLVGEGAEALIVLSLKLNLTGSKYCLHINIYMVVSS